MAPLSGVDCVANCIPLSGTSRRATMFYVYILKSKKTGQFYVGQTAELEKRIERHNRGGSMFTRHRGPFELVFSETYRTRREAMKREKEIKSYKGGNEFIKLLASVE